MDALFGDFAEKLTDAMVAVQRDPKTRFQTNSKPTHTINCFKTLFDRKVIHRGKRFATKFKKTGKNWYFWFTNGANRTFYTFVSKNFACFRKLP